MRTNLIGLFLMLLFSGILVNVAAGAVKNPTGAIFLAKGQDPAKAFIIRRGNQELPPDGKKTEVFSGDIVEPAPGVILEYVPMRGNCARVPVRRTFKVESDCLLLEKRDNIWAKIECYTGSPLIVSPYYKDAVIKKGDESLKPYALLLKPFVVFINVGDAAPDVFKNLRGEINQRPGFILAQEEKEADLTINLNKSVGLAADEGLKAAFSLAKGGGPTGLANISFDLSAGAGKELFDAVLERLSAYSRIRSLCEQNSYTPQCGRGSQAPVSLIARFYEPAQGKDEDSEFEYGDKKWKPSETKTPLMNHGELSTIAFDGDYLLRFEMKNISEDDYFVYLLGVNSAGRVYPLYHAENGQVAHQRFKKGDSGKTSIPVPVAASRNSGSSFEAVWLIASPDPLILSPYLQKSAIPDRSEKLDKKIFDPQVEHPYLMPEKMFVSGMSFTLSPD